MVPAAGGGIEGDAKDVFGGKPLRQSSKGAKEVCLPSVGSGLVEDPLPWGVGTLPISIREGYEVAGLYTCSGVMLK
jgi:hypothetical protein